MEGTRTRQEHVEWCKRRALEYCQRGDWMQAMASMGSDLTKHPETANHPAITLGMQLMMMGNIADTEGARKFIEGFN